MKAVSKKTIAILDGFVGAKIYNSDKVIASYEIIESGENRRLLIKFTDGNSVVFYKNVSRNVRIDDHFENLILKTLPKITKCGIFKSRIHPYIMHYSDSYDDLIIDPSSIKMTRKEFDALVNSKSIKAVCDYRSRMINHLSESIDNITRRLRFLQMRIDRLRSNLDASNAIFSIGCYIPNKLSDNSMSGISNHIKSFYKDVQITDKE